MPTIKSDVPFLPRDLHLILRPRRSSFQGVLLFSLQFFHLDARRIITAEYGGHRRKAFTALASHETKVHDMRGM